MRILGLLVVGIATVSMNAMGVDAPCRHSVPQELLTAAESAQSSWRLVELADLSGDDRKTWASLKHGRCPGVARADFDRSGRPQYALLLNSSSERRSRLLYAVRTADGKFEIRVLYEGSTSNSPVVFAGKQGRYSSAQDRESIITLKSSPVILAVLESGATAFYFVGAEVRQLVISE